MIPCSFSIKYLFSIVEKKKKSLYNLPLHSVDCRHAHYYDLVLNDNLARLGSPLSASHAY